MVRPRSNRSFELAEILSSNSSRGACCVFPAGFVSTPFGRGMHDTATPNTTIPIALRFRIAPSGRGQCAKGGTSSRGGDYGVTLKSYVRLHDDESCLTFSPHSQEGDMNAIKLLKQQHREVEALF